MTYDVPILRHVTSNKTYDFCMFSKTSILHQSISNIGAHINILIKAVIKPIVYVVQKKYIERFSKL